VELLQPHAGELRRVVLRRPVELTGLELPCRLNAVEAEIGPIADNPVDLSAYDPSGQAHELFQIFDLFLCGVGTGSFPSHWSLLNLRVVLFAVEGFEQAGE